MEEAKLREQLKRVVEWFQREIATIRSGRATPALVEDVIVEAYGGTQRLPIKQLATILVDGPQSLVIEPWDKTILGEIQKAILKADLGLSPIVEEEARLRIKLPPLTSEDKEKYLRLIGQKLHQAKESARRVRDEVRRELITKRQSGEISEDEFYQQQAQLDKIVGEFIDQLEDLAAAKKQEIGGEG